MTEEFHGPEGHRDEDEKDYQDSQSQSRTDWDKIFYKPVSGDENLVRILPGIGTARYHFKGGKHFIKHPDKKEMFVCNFETYGKPCPACEEFDRLDKLGKDDDAKPFKPSVKGVFNVIDRTNPERGVILWECPPVAVWERIIGLVKGKSKFNDLVGSVDDPLAGRDVVVIYNPKATPQFMYDLQFDAVSQLGKKKEVAAWLASARPLEPKTIYPEVDYDVAKIKTFGSKEEREELRKKLAEQYEAKSKKEEKKEKAKADDEKAEDLKKIAELEKQIADMKSGETGKGEAKEEEKPEETKAEEKTEEKEETKEEVVEKKEEVKEEKPESSTISELRKQLEEAEKKEAEDEKPAEKEEAKAEEKTEEKEETKEEVVEKKEEVKKGEETPEELALKIAKIRSKHEA